MKPCWFSKKRSLANISRLQQPREMCKKYKRIYNTKNIEKEWTLTWLGKTWAFDLPWSQPLAHVEWEAKDVFQWHNLAQLYVICAVIYFHNKTPKCNQSAAVNTQCQWQQRQEKIYGSPSDSRENPLRSFDARHDILGSLLIECKATNISRVVKQ